MLDLEFLVSPTRSRCPSSRPGSRRRLEVSFLFYGTVNQWPFELCSGNNRFMPLISFSFSLLCLMKWFDLGVSIRADLAAGWPHRAQSVTITIA